MLLTLSKSRKGYIHDYYCLFSAEVNRMGPLIDLELEKVDRKHAHLTQLSSDLVDALNLYHTLMREPAHLGQVPQVHYPQQMPHMVCIDRS